MMQVNDYGRMIFNGDQGLVLRVSDHGRAAAPMVVFPRDDGFIALPDRVAPRRTWSIRLP